jgi:hypothetical protein
LKLLSSYKNIATAKSLIQKLTIQPNILHCTNNLTIIMPQNRRIMLKEAGAPGRATISEKPKVRGQTNCRPWPFKLGNGDGANNSTQENFTVAVPWRRKMLIKSCSSLKEEE